MQRVSRSCALDTVNELPPGLRIDRGDTLIIEFRKSLQSTAYATMLNLGHIIDNQGRGAAIYLYGGTIINDGLILNRDSASINNNYGGTIKINDGPPSTTAKLTT